MMKRILGVCLASALLLVDGSARETYSEWLARFNVPDNRRGTDDDPAGDQVSNLVKYALGLNPILPAGHLLPKAELTTVNGSQRLVMRVPKNTDAVDIAYVVEASSDLSTWSTAGTTTVSETANLLTVADTVPLSAAAQRFLRLRVTLADPVPGVVTWDQVNSIRGILDQAITAYEIPGILYSVKVSGQDAFTDGRGVRDRQSGEAIAPNDRFRIGSASKTFVGMAILKLIHEGKLGFDHAISNYLPATVLPHYRKDLITIRMLLQHTSGINNYTALIEEWFMPYITNRTRVWTHEQLVALVDAKFAAAPEEGGKVADPGLEWHYSNTNTILLAMILEKVTGTDTGTYITKQFIEPLGLTGTIYPRPGESVIPGNHARGYMDWSNFTGEPSLPGLTDVTVYDPSGVGPAGPMISTVRDLGAWMEAIVKNEQLIGDLRSGHIDWRYFTSFTTAAVKPKAGTYGMKLAHEPDAINNADYYIIGHRGQISGYDTSMMYLPEKSVALVVVCTRSLKFAPGFPTNASDVALNKIVGLLFPDIIAANKRSVAPTTPPARALQTPSRRFAVPLAEY